MKTDRFSSAFPRAAAVLLVCLLSAAGLDASGRTIKLGTLKVDVGFESRTKELSAALAPKVEAVQTKFKENRLALQTLKGPGGAPVYSVQAVTDLISRTGANLDQAIEQVGEPGLDGLRAWSADKLQSIQTQLNAVPVQTSTVSSGLSTPRAVAVVASLAWLPLPAKVASATPKTKTNAVPVDASNQLLDQLGQVVDRIFFLASHDDLEVKLWVGSTPAQKATFLFWSQGQIKGSQPAATIVQTNGKRDHVLRGLYDYQVTLAKGSAAELIEYPNPAAQIASERLDLVNGSSFFCCRFNEQYCHHVADQKECRP